MNTEKLAYVGIRTSLETRQLIESDAASMKLSVSEYIRYKLVTERTKSLDKNLHAEKTSVKSSSLSDEAKEGLEFFGKHYKMIIRLLISLKMEHNMYSDKLLSPEEIDYTMDCAEDFYKTYGIQKPPEDEANEPDNA